MMAVCPMMSPDDDEEINPVALERIVRSLTARDIALIDALEKERRIDVDTLAGDGYDASQLIWLAHYALCGVEIDPGDRVFFTRTKEGKAALDARRGVVRPPRKRRGRPPVGGRF